MLSDIKNTAAAAGFAVFFLFLSSQQSIAAQADLTQIQLAQISVRESAPVAAKPIPSRPTQSQSVQSQSIQPETVLPAATAGPVQALAPPPAPSIETPNHAYQIQQLQQEVLELRGLLEEAGFELKRIKQQRLDDYLDLDKRLTEIGRQINKQGVSERNNSLSLVQAPASVQQVDEKALYRKAIDQLLNQQDYKGAKASFDEYMEKFPKGEYLPNVYYWQGQIFLADKNAASAEVAFLSLVSQFPEHAKTADAKYKLATIYHGQGKKAESKVLLEQVAAGESDAARLAKSFLANQF